MRDAAAHAPAAKTATSAYGTMFLPIWRPGPFHIALQKTFVFGGYLGRLERKKLTMRFS